MNIAKATVLVTVLAIALISFACAEHDQIHGSAFRFFESEMRKLIKVSADSIARVQHAANQQMEAHGIHAALLAASNKHLNKHLLQASPPTDGGPSKTMGNPCPGAATATCSGAPSASVMSCFIAAFEGQPSMNGMFALPQLLCQLSSGNSSCVSTIIGYIKTCSCMDFGPLYDIACPNSANACSNNIYVKQLIATQSVNNTLFDMGSFPPVPQPTSDGKGLIPPSLDLSVCGDHTMHRDILLINNMGACLGQLLDAFPLPEFIAHEGAPPLSVIRKSLKCSVTWKPFYMQATCSGNVAKCYSSLKAPTNMLPSCLSMPLPTAATCPSGCSTELRAFGTANNSASCCVAWFQALAADTSACSTTPVSSVRDVMGPGCVESFTESLQYATEITSSMKTMFMNFLAGAAVFPAPCLKKSPLSLGVAACNVATTNLAVTCPENTNSYVASSPFTPKQTTVASLTFNSGGLANVFKQKYSKVLLAVGEAMQAQLGPTVVVVCTSVVQVTARRLLTSTPSYRATLSISSTSLSPDNYNPQTSVNGLNAASMQSALATELTTRVDSSITVASVTSTATTVQTAPAPVSLPTVPLTVPAPPSGKNSAATLRLLPPLLLLCAVLLAV